MSVILKGSASSIPGFYSVAIDPRKILDLLHRLEHYGVSYGLGSKPASLSAWPPRFVTPDGQPTDSVDCSGFARLAWHHATGGDVLCDGSSAQNDYLRTLGLKCYGHDGYSACANKDNVLRLCFCRAGSRGEAIGHVWYTWNGWTLESHGGKGPDSRPWDCAILAHIVTDCYVLGKFA